MRIFKQSYRDKKTGELKKTSKWYIEFRDHEQTIRRWPAFTDKARSNELGRKLTMLVQCRISGDQPDVGLNAWLETIPKTIREKLGRVGILDQRRLAATEPIMHHLEDFKASLAAKGTTAKHTQQSYNRIKRIVEGCGFSAWSDITGSAVGNYLNKLRDGGDGISAQTFNFYTQSIKQFCKWMVQEQRASVSPVEHLSGLKVSTDRRHVRRALTIDEAKRLLASTTEGNTHSGMTGQARALLYRVAVETGLRANELSSLTRQSFDVESEQPKVTVQAGYSKRRREDHVPMRAELAQALRPALAAIEPAASVFTMPRAENVAKMLRKDLKAAGIPYKDEDGKVADFHALRHTCGSWLMAANVHPKIIQQVMRHSTITLTMDRYTHTLKADEVRAVNQLPELTSTLGRGVEAGPSEPEKLGVSLGASGTKTCDSGRQDETNSNREHAESEKEKSPNSLDKQGKTGLKRRHQDTIGTFCGLSGWNRAL